MRNMNLILFGTAKLSIDGHSAVDLRAAKAQALLAFLAIESDRPHNRAALQALLWPELSATGAKNALRVTLYRLRTALDEAVPASSDQLLTITRQSVQLNRDAVDVDVLDFQSRMAAAAAHRHEPGKLCDECRTHLLAAVTLAQGELLTGLDTADAAPFDEWLLMQRERLRAQTLNALAQLADISLQQHEFADAHAYAMRQLSLDPLREAAHRQVLHTLLQRGLLGDAKRHYDRMEQLLQAELGVAPAPETQELLPQVRQDPVAASDPNSTSDDRTTEAMIGPAANVPAVVVAPPRPRQFLGDAPLHGPFFGRHHELSHLRHWLRGEHCRLVAILGLGGMGKSTLAAHLTADVAEHYDVVIWYSLLNAPELPELLVTLLHMLPQTPLPSLPDGLDALLNLLFVYLQEQRVLIILDNLESILAPDGHGAYRDGYAPYAQLLKRIALREHRGQVLITSRERPGGFGQLESDLSWVRSYHLAGLDAAAAHDLLQTRAVAGTAAQNAELVTRYSGNPLALKLVADTIDDIFGGRVDDFLAEEAVIFDDIRVVLDEQVSRLSELEREILYWMALAREPVSVQQLQRDLLQQPSFRQLLEALRQLQRCSLVEPVVVSQRGEAQTERRFGLQNVVLEYLTDQLIELAAAELQSGNFALLHRHALLKAHTKEYLRRSQIRLLVEPIVHRLERRLTHTGLSDHLLLLVRQLQTQIGRRPSYAGGTLLNLLILQKTDLTGVDFSGLCLWHVDLQHTNLAGVNLSQADMTNTAFRETFGRLEALVASPDGRWLAGGGEGGDLRLYPLDERLSTIRLRGHTNSVVTICFSPDSKVLASAGNDHMLKMWNVDTGGIWRTFTLPSSILSLAYNLDGTILASGEANGDVRFWHAESGELLAKIHGHTEPVMQIAFYPDSTLLASCGFDGYVRIWRTDSLLNEARNRSKVECAGVNELSAIHGPVPVPIRTMRADDQLPFRVLGISHDGRYLAAGTVGGKIMMCETECEKSWRALGSHDDAVLSLVFHPRQPILATCGDDAAIRLWNANSGECIEILEEHDQPVWSAVFSPDGSTLASASADGTIRRWQFAENRQMIPLQTLFGTIVGIETLAWSPDGCWIATGDRKGTLRVWAVDKPVPHCVHIIHGHTAIHSLRFSPDSCFLATAGIDPQNGLRIWDVKTGRQCAAIFGKSMQSGKVAYAPNGNILTIGGRSGNIELWDVSQLEDIRLVRSLHGHPSNINALIFNPMTARLLASCGRDMTVRLWDADSGDELAGLPSYGNNIAVQFDPTGRYLVIEDQHNTIALWDLVDLSQPAHVLTFEGHVDSPLSMAFHPDGSRLVSGGLDRTVRLWDTETGRMIKTIGHHDGYVTSVAFSPDGEFVASAGKDDVVRIWHVESGERLHTLLAPGPYEGMNIAGVTGISATQRESLKALGAVEV